MQTISTILKYLRPYRGTVILLVILSLVSALANATIPYLAGSLVDHLITANRAFFTVVAIWVVLKAVTDIVDWRMGVFSDKLETLLQVDYLIRGLGKMLEFPMKFHRTNKTGEAFDKINTASKNIGQIVSRIAVDLAPQFLSIIFALAFISFIHPVMGAIVMAALLLYTLIIVQITPKLAQLFKRMYRSYNKAYGDAYDVLENISTVKQAAAELYEQERIHKSLRLKAAPLEIKIYALWQNLSFWQKVIITLTQLGIFLYSFSLITTGQLTIGQVVAVNAYTALVFGPFVVLARNWHILQNGVASLKISEELLDTPAEAYIPHRAIVLKDVKGKVEFRNVSFAYEEDQPTVLNDISFTAMPGEKIALVGRSGQGKSTLMDLLALYYRPTNGTILLDGRDIKRLDLRSLRSSIAVVPQEIVLFHDTILNNIRYGSPHATAEQVKEACMKAHADEFIQKFPKKYRQLVGERGVKLSVGQRQRIAIARAILKNPAILVLDEPTSALDAQLEHLIQESLDKLTKSRTTFVIAHRLSTVRNADRILVLEEGRIAEMGSHQELIDKEEGIYRNLYELQFGTQSSVISQA